MMLWRPDVRQSTTLGVHSEGHAGSRQTSRGPHKPLWMGVAPDATACPL